MAKLVLLLHYLLASVVTVICACVLQTQMVLLRLTDLDIVITWPDRLSMSWQDLIGLLPSYGAIVTTCLAIGFIIATYIKKHTTITSYSLYGAAGATTMGLILLGMHPILDITLLAGARSVLGIVLQLVAGLIGGSIFGYLRKAHWQKYHSSN